MNTDKTEKILQLIKNDKAQEDHLFKILAVTKNPLPLLKPLKEAGYFTPEKNPAPIKTGDQKDYYTVPYWNVLDYLENVAKYIKINPTEEMMSTLIEIIDSIIEYKSDDNQRTENYMTDLYIVKIIFSLPVDKITYKYFEFIDIALKSRWNTTLISNEFVDSIIPELLRKHSKELLLQLFQIILDFKINKENSFDKYVSIIDDHYLLELLSKQKESITKLCGKEIAELTLRKIKMIIDEDKSQFNNIWIRTIENHSQNQFIDRYEYQLIQLVRDIYQELPPNEISEKISDLLVQDHPIFKRLAVHLINYHYSELKDLFWNLSDNLLNNSLLKHELYELIKNNCKAFDEKQIKLLITLIEEKEYYVSEENKDNQEIVEKIIAYRKKEWLYALLECNDKTVANLYNKYDSINSALINHPGFNSWWESSFGSISPIDEVGLMSKSVAEIVIYLNNFEEETGWKQPTIEGLSGILRTCVSENIEKFENDLQCFLEAKRVYQYALLWGFSDAWRSNKKINWESLFNFIKELIYTNNFWNEEYQEKGYNYRDWIISQIADLINDGTKDDNNAFDPKYLQIAEQLLLFLIDKSGSNFYNMGDIVTSVLNSVRGKIFTAMINYSLRHARIKQNEDKNRWPEHIKNDFTNRLDKNFESSLDFTVVIGEYIPYLYYLDHEWVTNNLEKIFTKEIDEYWISAFSGYLYSTPVYKDIYDLLSRNEHYKKAISVNFEDNFLTERVAQHICVAYLEDWENIDDDNSLISLMIKSNNTKHLFAIINFFWMQRNNLTDDKVKSKIKPLWEKLFSKIKDETDKEEYQKLISDTSKFLMFVDSIDDDIFIWLKLSSKFIEPNISAGFYIEYLLKHVETTPEKVAVLFLEMLKHDHYPYYKKEHILDIISKLNSNNQHENAVRICNLYLNKGFDFTRQILETIK